MRLLSVPKEGGERDEVQAELFAGGWSTAELDGEILGRYGRRRRGGRRKRVGGGDELLGQLEAFCQSWRRWYALIDPDDADAGESPIDELPDDVRDAVTRAARAIARLHEAVTAATGSETASKE
jgi:hypothetical protein